MRMTQTHVRACMSSMTASCMGPSAQARRTPCLPTSSRSSSRSPRTEHSEQCILLPRPMDNCMRKCIPCLLLLHKGVFDCIDTTIALSGCMRLYHIWLQHKADSFAMAAAHKLLLQLFTMLHPACPQLTHLVLTPHSLWSRTWRSLVYCQAHCYVNANRCSLFFS